VAVKNNLQVAKQLLEWNKANLVCSSDIEKNDLSELFAKNFTVIANGRTYDANFDNYVDFLNQFKANIRAIDYDIYEFHQSHDAIIMPMTAHITRLSGVVQHYEAILILKFDGEGKVKLWHEVYIEVGCSKGVQLVPN
jgi:hypothetical protein